MILGLTKEERNSKLKSIMLDVLGAIEAGDASVQSFDVDFEYREGDDDATIEVSFTVASTNTLVEAIGRTLWGRK